MLGSRQATKSTGPISPLAAGLRPRVGLRGAQTFGFDEDVRSTVELAATVGSSGAASPAGAGQRFSVGGQNSFVVGRNAVAAGSESRRVAHVRECPVTPASRHHDRPTAWSASTRAVTRGCTPYDTVYLVGPYLLTIDTFAKACRPTRAPPTRSVKP